MDIKFLHSHLLEYLDTKATPSQIAKYLTLCGPSVEKVEKVNGNDHLYSIEITTNRVDAFSVYGVAREALAILPRFKVNAKLKKINASLKDYKFKGDVKYLSATVNPNLCSRFSAVLIKNVKISDSPNWIKERLEASGIRSLNNIVDISNYIMLTLGQPVHTFDYDKINKSKMVLRESTKGETITTLDGKEFKLSGGDIVIEDGEKRLIDLAGIMGGDLSKVDEKTKNVLLFVQTYNPTRVRRTSMMLAQRSVAASIFEKGTDEELVSPAILMGINLFKKLTGGTAEKEILDIYPKPYKQKEVKTSLEFINGKLGIEISKNDISNYLSALEFKPKWEKDILKVGVPSFRANDFDIEEDVVEEIARIYGYHNLPSILMTGELPMDISDPIFKFETEVKNTLKALKGVEVYTLSLVSSNMTDENSLKLKNPLGDDTSYLRGDMMPSLVQAANFNVGTIDKFHLFEISNIYLAKKQDLPEERLMLAGIFYGYDYRKAKGVIETFLQTTNIPYEFIAQENKGLTAGKSLSVYSGKSEVGKFGYCQNSNFIYYEFEAQKLLSKIVPKKFTNIPKYPSQVEDLTFTLPEKTKVGEVIKAIKYVDSQIVKVELKDIFESNFTFNIEYQNPDKTLTDSEVEALRKKIISTVKTKFGASFKE